MKARHFIAAACGFLLFSVARAATPPPVQGVADDTTVYQRSIAKIEGLTARGIPISQEIFKGFNWVGRTAAINYACSAQEISDCRRLLSVGLSDRALVVRDHALRVILASDKYVPEEKSQVARSVLEDPRNYRSGAPLWIVERARKYLEGFRG